ncbi:hypothetical protein ACIP5N_23565 [Streptomyces sp. NPDC088768]|uniref:hypothetical protein n=1 Tax=Streptomyces sp. NPDC088768 TaxID=3365894 RepID=UPI0038285ADD
MRRTFTWHAGPALVCGASLVALGLCAGRPFGRWTAGAGWLVAAGFAAALPTGAAALLRCLRAGVDRSTLWASFRCLPRAARLSCAGLLLAGVLVTGTAFAGFAGLQDAKAEAGGGYSALDTRTKDRVRISRERYEEVRAAERRGFLALPGTLLVLSGAVVLTLGEWDGAGHRAGAGRTPATRDRRGAA